MSTKVEENPYISGEFKPFFDDWGLDAEQLGNLFQWHLATKNIISYHLGEELIGYTCGRPMTKEMLERRRQIFEWDKNGEYLYVSAMLFLKKYQKNGFWHLQKGIIRAIYPKVKYLAFESVRDPERKLMIEEIN